MDEFAFAAADENSIVNTIPPSISVNVPTDHEQMVMQQHQQQQQLQHQQVSAMMNNVNNDGGMVGGIDLAEYESEWANLSQNARRLRKRRLLQTTDQRQKEKDRMKNRYLNLNAPEKDRVKDRARNRYRSLSNEEKEKVKERARNRYRQMSFEGRVKLIEKSGNSKAIPRSDPANLNVVGIVAEQLNQNYVGMGNMDVNMNTMNNMTDGLNNVLTHSLLDQAGLQHQVSVNVNQMQQQQQQQIHSHELDNNNNNTIGSNVNVQELSGEQTHINNEQHIEHVQHMEHVHEQQHSDQHR